MKRWSLSQILEWRGTPLLVGAVALAYVVSMFVAPLVMGDFSWKHMQAVWDRWQALNVGMLAFVASLIAFSISRGKERRQLQREFLAARAFLPHALSELCEYCDACADVLMEIFHSLAAARKDDLEPKIDVEAPHLPALVSEVFAPCIRSGDMVFAGHLAELLTHLQVFGARLRRVSRPRTDRGVINVITPYEVLGYLVQLGKIRARIDNTFSFARGGAVFKPYKPTLDDVGTAFSSMNVHLELIEGLMERARRDPELNGREEA